MIYAYRRINPRANTIVPLFEHDWPETPPPEPWDDYDLDGVRDVKTDCKEAQARHCQPVGPPKDPPRWVYFIKFIRERERLAIYHEVVAQRKKSV